MNSNDIDYMLSILSKKATNIIDRIFIPGALIHPGSAAAINKRIRDQFENAILFYQQKEFVKSLEAFQELELALDANQGWLKRVARWNEAACAIVCNKHDHVVNSLHTMHINGSLYGLPLWNLALAYYRLNRIDDARIATKTWIARDRENNNFRHAKCELIIACLSMLLNDQVGAKQHLEKAWQRDSHFIANQLGIDQDDSSILATWRMQEAAARQTISVSIPPEAHQQIVSIAQPRRPQRSPALSAYLVGEELERYAHALEALAEGDFEQGSRELTQLRETHPNVWLLDHACAVALILTGNYVAARDILLYAEQTGQQLNGAALWNLACAQIHIGDLKGALKALHECAQTEYRTKPELWVVLKILGSDREASGQVSTAPNHQTPTIQIARSLAYELPKDVKACRLEVLSRILKPKKMTKAYRPDLGRLPLRERQNVAAILDTANRATPTEAVPVLLPLISQYPDLYTLKIHAASYLVLTGELSQARSLLRQASNLQNLDTISRYNLAYIHLQQFDIEGVLHLLEGGVTSSLAEDFTFWLALAVARSISEHNSASDAAGRALALVTNGPSERTVRKILDSTRIRAASSTTNESPSILAARNALLRLDENDLNGAIQILEGARVSPEKIPEIGPQVLDPRLEERPGRRWDNDAVRDFNSAVRFYLDGQYGEAAAAHAALQDLGAGPALNMTAAYLQANEPKRAREIARMALRRYRRRQIWEWRLAYNYALAHLRLGEVARSVQIVQKHLRLNRRKLTGLLIALCDSETTSGELRDIMASSLDDLGKSVHTSSDNLMLTLAWAKLTQALPDAEGAKKVLRELAQRAQRSLLQPAAEVKSMQQVRTAYDHLKLADELKEAVSYMSTVIETRIQKRQSAVPLDISSRELEHSIGVELAARLCLVRAYDTLGDRERAIRELDETEALVKDYIRLLPPGFLARDWYELAQVADAIQLPWAAVRYCEQGLEIEPENKGLGKLKTRLSSEVLPQVGNLFINVDAELQAFLNGDNGAFSSVLDQIITCAPVLAEVLRELFDQMSRGEDNIDIEELCDRASVLSRMELRDQTYGEIDKLLVSIIRSMGRDEARISVDLDVYDEKIWPRIYDDREGSCLLILNSRHDIPHLTVQDLMSERRVWEGGLEVGKTQYVRWTVYREDGFSPDTSLDLPLLLRADDPSGQTTVRTAVNVLVGASEPTWPSYPTGALTPEDVPGEELYGRLQLIRTITRSLARMRNQATFFIQAPRQMGKTSLLYFVKNQVPNHVLPVYVNLEKQWSKHEPNNLWNYLVQRVYEEETKTILVQPLQNQGEADLIEAVRSACNRLKKTYALLLLDELHFLFEKSDHPSDILATFRDFLNNQDSRIALLLSDRYTRDELETRCASEYWAQLSLLNIGPLDQTSTKQAIEFPTRGTDVTFLPETIDRLYSLTGGYPYHVQRAAQYLLESMYSGPWLTALPSDIDSIIPKILDQDILFQSGLCRPDRIDIQIAEAIAALLEWRDLCDFLPALINDIEGPADILRRWQPNPQAFLAHMKNPDQIFGRLKDIGVFREDGEGFFSPLLELWLIKMRKQSRNLIGGHNVTRWQIISVGDGGNQTAREWQNLDSELVRCTKYRGKPPLKEKSTRADDWDTLIREVASESDFCLFLDAAFRLFIDERDEKATMLQYPWLYLAYHRTRLVRNYVVHRSKTKTALMAWNTVCVHALGGERSAYWPATSEEWRAVQVTILRALYAGINNALEIAGRPN